MPDTKIEAPRHAQADDDGGLKTIKEIADHLKVGKNTIRRWIDERDFPSRRAGDDYRFDLNEVDRWTMEAHTNLSKNNGHKC
ncbi:MAG: helix-turn-helix domain-containing protein [Blastocatellia bacterium]